MSRITCRTPSTGKPLNAIYENVPTTFTPLIEAPDFSVPDPSNSLPNRDPLDDSRAIRPGEVFLLTPMYAKNKHASNTVSLEVTFQSEEGANIEITLVNIPKGETTLVPLQGRSLLKRDPDSANGDMILIKAQESNSIDVWVSAEEKLSSEHIGVES
jgi:hypothetical protein